ncbi:MAG: glycosyltransferase family 4 protein [Acidimicrobiales bacterium]
MRIGLISPPWIPVPPPAYGGTETVIDSLACGLAAAGHEVVLFASGDSECHVARRWHFAEATGIGRPDGELLEIRHVIGAYEQLADCDVVHDHTLAGPLYAAGYSALPVVTTNHGPFEEGLDEYYAAVSPRIPVIAISRSQAASARSRVAAVIHHGVDVDEFPEGDGKGGYAMFLGRLAPTKGVHVAAQVAREAGIPLLIAGKCSEPAEQAYFEERVKPLLGGKVEFVGELGRKSKLDLLSKASCLLNPIAWREPFGMVMIEALACGTPVVATNRGAAPEIVEDGVTGVLADGVPALVEALAAVPSLDRERCRQAARDHFSVEKMVAGHLSVYWSLLEAHETMAKVA